MDYSYNNIGGSLDSFLNGRESAPALEDLHLQGNALSGTLPAEAPLAMPKLLHLYAPMLHLYTCCTCTYPHLLPHMNERIQQGEPRMRYLHAHLLIRPQ